jgi:hypothetical protein
MALARGARILNHGTRALADRAGARHAEESLLIAYLSMAVALPALAGSFAIGRTGAMAGVAQLVAPDIDFLLYSEGRVFKGNGQVFADVGPTLRARAPSPATSSVAEQIAEAEHLSEQVAQIHLLETARALSSASVGKGIMAEAVISGALLLIAEHGIRFAALLEALLALVVVRVAVRVILQR